MGLHGLLQGYKINKNKGTVVPALNKLSDMN
jgi:hypothetical protein